MGKIKLTKVQDAFYGTKAIYEWEGHEISGDDCCLGGGIKYWYCETLFKNSQFRTLRGLRKAIELKVNGELTWLKLQECEDE
jgi:hypothetical protein